MFKQDPSGKQGPKSASCKLCLPGARVRVIYFVVCTGDKTRGLGIGSIRQIADYDI